ncbi:MAG: RsmB/NOP family class I SAM-dependent RNA methyltransferase, partial [Acidobacteriota bacterium]
LARLSIVASTPPWMLERWQRHWGFEETSALAMECSLAPSVAFRYNERNSPRETTDTWLREHGLTAIPSRLVPGGAVIARGSLAPDALPVSQNWIYLQEESSQLVARLATPAAPPGPQAVWDVCAAPGGKSALISTLLPASSRQVATDLHESRLRLMRDLFARQGVENIRLARVDLTAGAPFAPECFDQILVDAPCSGIGTIQKHPEIKWRITPEKIRELAEQQKQILETASESLRAGGLLTYSVCSTESEEGEEVIRWFRERHQNYRDVTRERLVEIGLDPDSLITKTHGARTFPHRHHTEGFFICVLWKRR